MSLSETLSYARSEPHAQPGAKLKRSAINAALMAAILTTTAAGYEYWQSNRYLESTNDAYVGGDVAVIAPKVAGFIAKLGVSDNQRVHAATAWTARHTTSAPPRSRTAAR
jgi:membrane fusion protein (multidrug efflux system)